MVAYHPKLNNISDKCILFSLKLFMDNRTGGCYPTEKQIAEVASASEKTVRKVLKKSVDLRILERTLNKPKTGRGYKNYSYKPLIPSESLTGRSNKPPVNVTKPPVNEVQNHRNQLPPNYPDNYSNNYNDSKKFDKNEKKIELIDVGEVITIRESHVKTRSDLLKALITLKNGYAQEELIDWVIENDFSEIKSRDQLPTKYKFKY